MPVSLQVCVYNNKAAALEGAEVMIFNVSPRTIGDIIKKSEHRSIGDGQVSVEYYDGDENFLFELFYENGTRCSYEEFVMSKENFASAEAQMFSRLLPIDERINRRG